MIRKYTNFLVFLASFLASIPTQAGAWVTTGGELFKDAHNPWFLRNTSQVNYCIQVGSSISQPKDQVQEMVRKAIEFWKAEFMRLQGNAPVQKGGFVLATQDFKEMDCSSTGPIDLRILFGFETLAQSEREYLQDPKKYVGVTVRTEYDEVQLKAKGFMFISSDQGSNAYLNEGDLIEKAWQHPKLLQYALMHEFGHVFGFPHIGGGLMSEVFLEQTLNKKLYENFMKAGFESVLSPESEMEVCRPMDAGIKAWMGVPQDHQCIRFVASPADQGYEVSSRLNEKAQWSVAGKFKSLRLDAFDFRSKPTLILQLTSKQKVFTPEETAFRSFMNGPMMADFGASTAYIPANGTAPKSGYVRVSSNSFTLFGNVGNQSKPLFIYQSPLSLLLTLVP